MLHRSTGRALALATAVSLTFTAGATATADVTLDFNDLPLPGPASYYAGSDNAGGFTTQGVHFSNNFQDSGDFTSWDGFAYSHVNDTTTADFTNQFAAFPGTGRNGASDDIYTVGYYAAFADQGPTVTLPTPTTITGAYFTNTTYAALAMRDGDAFAQPFEQDDWFYVTVTGLDATGDPLDSLDVYLADYRSTDSDEHYIRETWTWSDLSELGEVHGLSFEAVSSDAGTPAYFALDELTVAAVPEPATLVLLAGGGALVLLRRRRRRRGLA